MLTNAKIRKLKPLEKNYKESDGGGLYLLVYTSGTKSFKIKYYYNQKEQTDTVGKYPSVSLLEARMRRDEIKRLIGNGIDPALEKKKKKAEAVIKSDNTFATLADSYVTKLKMHRPPRAPATIKKNIAMLNEANGAFGNIPIEDITTPMLAKLIDGRIKTGHYETAKRLRTIIGSVFRHAMTQGVVKSNPADALKGIVPQFEVKHRAAILDINEIGKLIVAIENDTGHVTTKIALKLIILFALRPIELRGAKWSEVDFVNREFKIPKGRMKARKPHTVILSEYAILLLENLKDVTGHSEYLFPSNGPKNDYMSENTLNQALRRMGYNGDTVTAHGFRATFSTNANESRLFSPDAIERYSARMDTNAVRGIYNRGGYLDERKKIAEWWTEQVLMAKNKASSD